MAVLSWFLGPKARVPDGEVIYAIGDIHGRDDLLAGLHATIAEELSAETPQAREATVIYLGDYVDRGRDSRAVIDRLLDNPVPGAKSVFLKGNHEDAMLRFLAGQESGESWLTIGGGATARSYGVSLKSPNGGAVPPGSIRAQLAAAIPERHLQFLKSLTLTHEAGDYLFVHAGVRPGLPFEDQSPRDLLWIRSEFLTSKLNHGKIVVHGHSSGGNTVVKRNRICVDTAAYATDCLSCVVLEGKKRRFISQKI